MEEAKRPLPGLIGTGLVGTELCLLLWYELRRPLRTATEAKLTRGARNVVVAALAALPVMLIERPVALRVARLAHARRWGLLRRSRLRPGLQTVLAILLLDYTLYLWHALTHRLPFLWRFHAVHHVDRDLDATTALRFHAGEMTISVFWRAAQIAAIGVDPFAYSLWQLCTTLSICFHHANLRLPERCERALALLIVTPRMHGTHHAADERLANGNWSSGLSLWDRLHGTLRSEIPQAEMRIGLPAYRSDHAAALRAILLQPFEPQRDAWLPEPVAPPTTT